MSGVKKYFLKMRESCVDTSVALKICFLLLGNIFLPTLIASIGFIFKINITNFTYVISQIILLVIYFMIFCSKNNFKKNIIPVSIYLIIILLSIFISSKIYDNSVDGWGYHNPAIIKLSEGWNPLYEHFDNDSELGIWSEHYPKAIWLYGASLYKLTNIFFVGYTFNIIIAFATLFLMYDIFQKKIFNNTLCIILAIIVSFGTITVGQLFTLYNDGVFCLCILGLLFLYNSIMHKKHNLNIITLLIISFYLSILANIKFNGALYAFLITLVYSLILMIKRILKWDKNLIIYILVIGLCVGIVASNTYITNIIYHNNIGYPIIGENKIEIIKQYIPNYIHIKDGNIESFIKSITSASFNEYIYNPFYVSSLNDYKCASSSDCRVNGFGPLYQLLLLVSIIYFGLYIIKILKQLLKKEITIQLYIKKNYYKYIPFMFMLVFFILAPATWWVRYVPFMHAVPMLIIIYFHEDWKKVNVYSILSYFIIVLYLISLIGIGNNMLKQTTDFSKNINTEIKYLKDYSKSNKLDIAPIDVSLTYNSYRLKMSYEYLENLDIEYKIQEIHECKIIKILDNLAINVVKCGGENNDSKN